MAYIYHTLPRKAKRAIENGQTEEIELPPTAVKTELNDGVHELSNIQVPQECFSDIHGLQWKDEKLVMPEDPVGDIFTLRGTDLPQMERLKGVKNTAWVENKTRGSVIFSFDDNSSEPITFGGQTDIRQGRVRWCVRPNTQVPSLNIEHKIKLSDDNVLDHRVVFHGNKSMKKVEHIDAATIKAGGLGVKIPEHHQKAAEEGRLLAVAIHYGESTNVDRWQDSIQLLFDKKGEEYDRWENFAKMIEFFEGKEEMDEKIKPFLIFDQAIQLMLKGQNMRIYFLREIDAREPQCLVPFQKSYRQWAHLMNVCVKQGPFWFYSMQPKFRPSTPGQHLAAYHSPGLPPVPFWLVNKFAATVYESQIISLAPLEWTGMVEDQRLPAHLEFRLPSLDCLTFLHELSLHREKQFEDRVARILFHKGRSHPVVLIQMAQLDDRVFYRADICVRGSSIADGTQTRSGAKVLPGPGSFLEMKFSYDDKRYFKLSGKVVNAMDKAEAVDLVLYCNASNEKADQLQRLMRDAEIFFDAEIKPIPHHIANARMHIGFSGIVEKVSAEKSMAETGPHTDARHFLLGYHPRFSGPMRGMETVEQVLAKVNTFVQKHMGGYGAFRDVCEFFGFHDLDDSQMHSIQSAIFGSKNNVTVVRGPPGTGKSHTLTCLIIVLNQVFGSKVAVTAPSDQACETIFAKLLEKLIHIRKSRGLICDVVRFTDLGGTPVGSNILKVDSTSGVQIDTEGLDQMSIHQRVMWKTSPEFAGFSFHEAKKTLAYQTMNTRELEHLKVYGSYWLKFIGAVHEQLLVGDLLEAFREADEALGAFVLEHLTGVLVGKLNSMGREDVDLTKCPIDTVIVDECAQASLADIAIPFAKFKKTCVRAIHSGDDLLLPAYLFSVRANEAAPVTGQSIFTQFQANPNLSITTLNRQYRCHEFIYRWSNETFYEGLVNTPAKINEATKLDRTVAAFLKQEVARTDDKFWDPDRCPRVIAIDINEESRTYPKTTTSFNQFEAEFALWLWHALTKFTPPEDGDAVTAKDIAVISPYRGQITALQEGLKDQGTLVSTVHNSQGSECAIGISSFAKNNLSRVEDVGFTSIPASLNVWTTRQQRFHFMTGNFVRRHEFRNILTRARADNATYKKFLEHLLSLDQKGSIVLSPKDFKSWPGFSGEALATRQPRPTAGSTRGGHRSSQRPRPS